MLDIKLSEYVVLILSTAKVVTDTCRNIVFIHTFPVMYISISLKVSTVRISALTVVPLVKRTPVKPHLTSDIAGTLKFEIRAIIENYIMSPLYAITCSSFLILISRCADKEETIKILN